MGAAYAATHTGLGRLAKIYDYGAKSRTTFTHPRRMRPELGAIPKTRRISFRLVSNMGPHPESFFGVHPWIAERKAYDVLLPYLVAWDSDQMPSARFGRLLVARGGLPHSVWRASRPRDRPHDRAFLRRNSEYIALFQALNAGAIISKDLLFKDVSSEDREAKGERFLLEFVDWELSGDPHFYENRHLAPLLIESSRQLQGARSIGSTTTARSSRARSSWCIRARRLSQPEGVHNVFVWAGDGTYGGLPVRGGDHQLDELLITHERAVQSHVVENTGRDDLFIIKFFGPRSNPDVPVIPGWQ